jgi:serine/threonine-protein kinase
VHGDVKPGNVIVDHGDRAVLIDLGVAADLRAGRGVGGGTPPYMAPEVAGGDADARADQYAAGILLVETLTGTAVSDRDDCARRASALPAPLASIVLRAIDLDPCERFASARGMRDGLRAAGRTLRANGFDGGVALVVPRTPSPSRVTVRSRRSPPE